MGAPPPKYGIFVLLFIFILVGSGGFSALLMLITAVTLLIGLRLDLRGATTPFRNSVPLHPFPFLVFLCVSVFVSDTHWGTYHLAQTALLFGLAWAIRLTFSARQLLWALLGASLSLAIWSYLGMVEQVETTLLGNFLGKNPTGWVLAVGLIASAVLILAYQHRTWVALALVLTFSALSLTLLLSNSLLSFLAGHSVVLILLALGGFIRISSLARKTRSGQFFRPWKTMVFLLVVATLVFLGRQFGPGISLPISQRNFETFTGRDEIWACYLAVSNNAPQSSVWSETVACSGFTPHHLHNIFLEAHYVGGWPLLLALGFGILTQLAHATYFILRSDAIDPDSYVAVGFPMLGLLVGLGESFLFQEQSLLTLSFMVAMWTGVGKPSVSGLTNKSFIVCPSPVVARFSRIKS